MKAKSIIKRIFLCAIFILIGIATTHPDVVSGSGGSGAGHTHYIAVAATCTVGPKCSCGRIMGGPLGHDWQSPYKYDNGGWKKKPITDSQGNTIGYTWVHVHDEHRKCSRCTKEWTKRVEAPINSGSTAPTCTSAGSSYFHCPKCGMYQSESIPALGHDWSGWKYDDSPTGDHWKKCNRCGAITDKAQHKDTNWNGYCNTCGYQMYILVQQPVIAQTEFIYNGREQSPVPRKY